MTHVLHLVRHDLKTHRRLLVGWLVVVVAQPLASLLPWPWLAATGMAVPFFLITSRVLLAAVALATIVQADSPLDDRTFWRTRPVRTRTMAAAKLAIGAVVVAVPLAVVLIVAAIVRAPLSHLPSTVAQVVVTDAAAVGLVLLLASRTRSISSMLIALLGTVVGSYILLIAMSETLRVPWVRQFYDVAPPNSRLATPTMLMVVVAAAWTMTALVFLGQRYRLRALLVGAVAILALAVIWLVPAARFHQPSPGLERRPALAADASRVRAERLESGRVALMTTGTLSGVQPEDRFRQGLVEGTIDAGGGPIATRQPGPIVEWRGFGPHPLLLGALSAREFERLAGRSAKFSGRIHVEIAPTKIIGALPLRAGASLDLGSMRMRIRELWPAVQIRPTFVPLATVDVTWMARWTEGARVPATQWRLRQGADRQDVFRFMQTPFVGFGLLPSLAWPFGRDRSVLYVPQTANVRVEAESFLEIGEHQRTVHTQHPLQLDFLVPVTALPVEAAGGSR